MNSVRKVNVDVKTIIYFLNLSYSRRVFMKKFLSIMCSLFIVFSSFTGDIGFAMDAPKKSSNCQVDENNDVHIFYCADDGNAMPTCVSIASVLENAGDEKINIHIVSFQDNEMSKQNIKNIEALKNIRNFDFDFVYFDKKRLDEFDAGRWNKSIMIKLYCAELFPNLDRIIWLDDDVIVLKSLKNLYNLDMGDKYLAGVDVSQEYHNNCSYWITAGIGLYNLKEMRKDNVQKSLLDSAKEFTYKKDKVILCGGVEEYALTYGMPKDKVLILPYRYSIMIFLYTESKMLPCAMNDIITLHFAGSDKKPWKNFNALFAEKWWEYAIKSGFYDKVPAVIEVRKKVLEMRSNPKSSANKTIDDGIYTISSKLDPNMCLGIKNGSKNNCANLQLLGRNGTDAQKFKLQYHSDGYYTIKTMCSGKMLDMLGGSKNILQCTKNKRNAQKWFIVPDGEGYYCLVSKVNNLCMDVCGAKAEAGANIHCWSIHGGNNQRFKLEKCKNQTVGAKKSA